MSASSLYRRLEVQLAEKTRHELLELIVRQQFKIEELKNPPKKAPGADEIELQSRLALVYYGDRSDKTLDEMIDEMERDANRLGHPLKEYIRRFDNSSIRRRL